MKFDKISNIWWLGPQEPINKIGQHNSKAIMKNHGGSLDIKKNPNMYLAPIAKIRQVHDPAKWRLALQIAENPIFPYRFEMQLMYMDTVLVPHIKACLSVRESLIAAKKIIIKNPNGSVNKKLTKYFNKPWVSKYRKQCHEAKWYGYTLIGMGDYDEINGDFINAVIVPRTHISPDRMTVSSIPKSPDGMTFYDQEENEIEFMGEEGVIWISTPDQHGLTSCGYGLLYELALLGIYINNNLNFNIEFNELFTTPFRQLKTDSLDERHMKVLEEGATQIVGTGFMVTGLNDELIFHNTGKGNSGEVFNSTEKRLHDLVSEIVLGHADAINSVPGKLGNDSNNSPAAKIMRLIENEDATFVLECINNQLFKFLKNGKYINIPEGCYAEFSNDEEQYEENMKLVDKAEKMSNIVEKLTKSGLSIDVEWFEEFTGIPVKEQEETDDETHIETGSVSNSYETVPMHMNCRCVIDDFTNEWLLGNSKTGPCDECRQAQKLHNQAIREGRLEDAKSIWDSHKGLI